MSYGGKFADLQFADWLLKKLRICGLIKKLQILNLPTRIPENFAAMLLRIEPRVSGFAIRGLKKNSCAPTFGI
jgi:hypothetical protein